MEEYFDPEQPVRIPVEDRIDLHTFSPREVPSLLEQYLSECVAAGIFEVRIVHGKGKGFLRETVHSFLRQSPLVASFSLADEQAGSWGATIVSLKRP
jgi:DNA-nicking Smr family endonuclease